MQDLVKWTCKENSKSHMSSWSELEYAKSSIESLKGGSDIGCKPKFLRVVVAATIETNNWTKYYIP